MGAAHPGAGPGRRAGPPPLQRGASWLDGAVHSTVYSPPHAARASALADHRLCSSRSQQGSGLQTLYSC
eukprot:scaffold2773_cov410-Prasinococcus_capsulatus_cf.AAC.13